jgi:AraC-like DNA-binding protein
MKITVGFLKNEYPKHDHKFYEIVIYTKGGGTVSINESKIPFSVGTIIVLPPSTMHESLSKNEFERIYINGSFDWILKNSEPIILQGSSTSDGLLLAELIYRSRFESSDYVSALVNAFIGFILQSIDIDDKMNEAIKLIANEITESFHDSELNLNRLLTKSGYSEDYIRSEFKKAIGKTPTAFLTETRISHACMLMDIYKTSLSLTEIAEKCGYIDYTYFSRRFKEIMGISPREYLYKIK